MSSGARKLPRVPGFDTSKRLIESIHVTEVMLKQSQDIESSLEEYNIWVPEWTMPLEEAVFLGLHSEGP